MSKRYFLLLIVLLAVSTWSFSWVEDAKINWIKWEEAVSRKAGDNKKVLVFIYSDNCNWCKLMENTTFEEPHIADYINKNFYPVRFNAQHKAPITFKGQTYKYIEQKTGGYHEFVAALTGGRLVFPMSVFVDEEGKVLQAIQGYKEQETFEMILTFYGDNYHKERPWRNHVKSYIPMTKKSGTIFISEE